MGHDNITATLCTLLEIPGVVGVARVGTILAVVILSPEGDVDIEAPADPNDPLARVQAALAAASLPRAVLEEVDGGAGEHDPVLETWLVDLLAGVPRNRPWFSDEPSRA